MVKVLSPDQMVNLVRGRNTRLDEAAAIVGPILEDVRTRGDAAVFEHARRLDGFTGSSLLVAEACVREAQRSVATGFQEALARAAASIEAFARLQMPREFKEELSPGHVVGQIVRPLDRIAAYVPGGRYPLPSTVLMTAVPARVANVGEVWITTPAPTAETLAAAAHAGVTRVAQIGGAQAIAAFAFGTESIPKVDRIVGPGNAYVAAAKKLLAGETGIDFVAGPTEVVIVADAGRADWIAADMLAQAEHDPDASAVLITTSPTLAGQVQAELERQLAGLATAPVARAAIEANGAIVLTDSVRRSIDLANFMAAEHLCLEDPSLLDQVTCAGSVFLGPWSCESAGDYATGPNHVLPTGGAARVRGGLSVTDFVRIITFQELGADALARVAPVVATLARAEGLEAHARAVEARIR